MMIKAILTKPLDGDPEGAEREFDEADFATLKTMGAVREAPVVEASLPAAGAPATEPQPTQAKAAAAPANKMAPSVANKAAKA